MTRGTISIGRRLQDPLAELVKIDPQHVGVGLYQHDVKPKHLKESIDEVIESCVNEVGVDLNTARASLLRYVSGLNPAAAQEIVQYRTRTGRSDPASQLLQVPNFGEARFTQAAAFLKIRDGDDPLDATWVHPESYPLARQLLAEAGLHRRRPARPGQAAEAQGEAGRGERRRRGRPGSGPPKPSSAT